MRTGTNQTEPLRVMVVGPGPMTEGGITEVIQRVMKALHGRAECRVTWLVMHRSGNAWQKTLAGISGTFEALTTIWRHDIVHIHSAAYISFFRKSVVFWLARVWRRPVIWHLHTPNNDFCDFFGSNHLSGRYGRWVLGKVNRVVVLSESWRPLVAPYVADSRLKVILNPIPDMDCDEVVRSSRRHVRILYLAHLIQRKGYPLLIRAFADLYHEDRGCKLVFAGSGETKEAQELCRKLGIEEAVEFLGWIKEPRRTDELRAADIFVLPSYQEGLPMGVLEAMAFGLAVVTTPVGGICDVVKDQKNGILVTPGNIEELQRALFDLVMDPEKRQRLGARARKDVGSFTAKNIAEKWLELYREVSVREENPATS